MTDENLGYIYSRCVLFSLLTILFISCKPPTNQVKENNTLHQHHQDYEVHLPIELPSPKETPKEEIKEANVTDWKMLGSWIDDFGSTYMMYKEGDIYYLNSNYFDGSYSTETMIPVKKFGKNGFEVVDNDLEFYFIKNKKLYIYDMFGSLGLVYSSH